MMVAAMRLWCRAYGRFGGEDDDRLIEQAAALKSVNKPATGRSTWPAIVVWFCKSPQCTSHSPFTPAPCMICTNRTPFSTRRRAASSSIPNVRVSGSSRP